MPGGPRLTSDIYDLSRGGYLIGAGKIYASLASALPAWMTLTRASDGWFRQADDVNGERWAAAGGNDIARFTRWLGSAGIGLLIEPARTNRCVRSAELGVAPWVDGVGTPIVTADARVAPDGTTTADDVEDDNAAASNPESREQGSLGYVLNDVITASTFVRVITGGGGGLTLYNAADFSGAVRTTSTTWTRLETTKTANGADNRIEISPAFTTWVATDTQVGKSAYWNTQTELGKYATSPIPTLASVVTRAADLCMIDLAKVAPLINADRGRIAHRAVPAFSDTQIETYHPKIYGLTATDYVYIPESGADAKKVVVVNSGVHTAAKTGALTWSANDEFLVDWLWGGGRTVIRVWKNGTLAGEADAAWTPPTLGATMGFAQLPAGSGQFAGAHRDLVIG